MTPVHRSTRPPPSHRQRLRLRRSLYGTSNAVQHRHLRLSRRCDPMNEPFLRRTDPRCRAWTGSPSSSRHTDHRVVRRSPGVIERLDVDACTKLMTDDTTLQLPGGAIVRGREPVAHALRPAWQTIAGHVPQQRCTMCFSGSAVANGVQTRATATPPGGIDGCPMCSEVSPRPHDCSLQSLPRLDGQVYEPWVMSSITPRPWGSQPNVVRALAADMRDDRTSP